MNGWRVTTDSDYQGNHYRLLVAEISIAESLPKSHDCSIYSERKTYPCESSRRVCSAEKEILLLGQGLS